MQGRVAVAGGDDAFDEAVRLADLLGGRLINVAVEAEYAAERTSIRGIAGPGPDKSLDQRLGRGGAAGVVMLQNHCRGAGEFANQIQRTIEIENVVIGQLLAVQHLGRGDRCVPATRFGVEGGALVRILAVAQGLQFGERKVQALGPARVRADLLRKIPSDGGIVRGGVSECRRGEPFPRRQAERTLLLLPVRPGWQDTATDP